MPEIGEVARAVHYLRKHLVGRTLQKVTAVEDGNVFGKVGTSHTEIMKKLTGKKVVDAGQQGKYFWLIMSSPPHLVMHFGMAGWLDFKSEHTFYYQRRPNEKTEWPPKYWKFMLETDGTGDDKVEAAYRDLRRFGRVRLVDCPGKDIRKHSPLVENGPDPVQDKDQVTLEWLTELCQRKKAPIKAVLLDQANISGIGNWVCDEIMYDAKMHPEQYANTIPNAQIKQLHKSIHYVCGTAVELLADSEQFPQDWLFKHRWGKGKKDASKTLPNGEKIVFLTVGGRTSAVVPSIQKKTGPVSKEMSEAEERGSEESADEDVKEEKTSKKSKMVKAQKPKSVKAKEETTTASKAGKRKKVEEDEEEIPAKTAGKKAKTTNSQPPTTEQTNGFDIEEDSPDKHVKREKADLTPHSKDKQDKKAGKQEVKKSTPKSAKQQKKQAEVQSPETPDRRRSARLRT